METRKEPITWPILNSQGATPEEFVLFWERLYSGYDEEVYQQNVGKLLTDDRIDKWFTWKNGTPLSARKAQSIRRYYNGEDRISQNADSDTLTVYLNRPGGAIWRIFWLHIQHPHHFPIYDQHVHRAMAFLLKWPDRNIPIHDPKKVKMYIENYCPFAKRFNGCGQRIVDRALWTFGRFLIDYGGAITREIEVA